MRIKVPKIKVILLEKPLQGALLLLLFISLLLSLFLGHQLRSVSPRTAYFNSWVEDKSGSCADWSDVQKLTQISASEKIAHSSLLGLSNMLPANAKQLLTELFHINHIDMAYVAKNEELKQLFDRVGIEFDHLPKIIPKRIVERAKNHNTIPVPVTSQELEVLTISAELGIASSLYRLGFLYLNGFSVPQNLPLGLHYLLEATLKMHPEAMRELAYMSARESAVLPFSIKRAYGLNMWAAKCGSAEAAFELGKMNLSDVRVDFNRKEGLRWLKVAANRRSSQAQFLLGRVYLDSEVVKSDISESLKWFRLSAAKGYIPAVMGLGDYYYSGKYGAKNYREAIKYYYLAAKDGRKSVYQKIGKIYFLGGHGVASNHEKAAKWYELSSDPWAKVELAYMYEFGLGVVRDSLEAKKNYAIAAELGNPFAAGKMEKYEEIGIDELHDNMAKQAH